MDGYITFTSDPIEIFTTIILFEANKYVYSVFCNSRSTVAIPIFEVTIEKSIWTYVLNLIIMTCIQDDFFSMMNMWILETSVDGRINADIFAISSTQPNALCFSLSKGYGLLDIFKQKKKRIFTIFKNSFSFFIFDTQFCVRYFNKKKQL